MSSQQFEIGNRVRVIHFDKSPRPKKGGRALLARATVGEAGAVEAFGWFTAAPLTGKTGFQYFVRLDLDRQLHLLREEWLEPQ